MTKKEETKKICTYPADVTVPTNWPFRYNGSPLHAHTSLFKSIPSSTNKINRFVTPSSFCCCKAYLPIKYSF